jgi:membrane associated rhomboid family serine protease
MRGDVTSRLIGIIYNFRVLFSFYLVILSLCVVVFVLGQTHPWIDSLLVASRSTPWGVVTSLFIHSDISHLAMNLVGLLSFLLVFTFTNYYFPADEIASRVLFFIAAILITTVLSNILWIIIANIGTIGASGLVYASEGAVTGFCLLNFWDLYNEARDSGAKGKRSVMLVNLFVFAVVCAWMLFYTNSFLSYGSDVNVLIHGSSFVLAFIISIEWDNIRNLFNR